MRYNKFLKLGAIELEPLKFYQGCQKTFGAMYGGSGKLSYKSVTFYFELWYHHSSDEEMSRKEVEEEISLKGIEYDGKFFDIHWHCVLTANEVWFHDNGWFKSSENERKKFENARRNVNYNIARTENVDADLLTSLGFAKII